MASPVKNQQTSGLTRELRTRLWARVMESLNQGSVLVADEDFRDVMEDAYFDLAGGDATQEVKRQIARMVAEVNKTHPEMYLAQGVQNAVNRAFDKGVRQLNWNLTKIQEKGFSTIRRFSKFEEIADLLAEANIRPDQIDLLECIKNAVKSIQASEPKEEPAAAPAPNLMEFQQALAALRQSEVAGPEVQSEAQVEEKAAVEEAVAAGEVDQQEARQRTQEAEMRRSELETQEMAKVPQNLAAYVDEGRITEEEAEKIKALRQVDEQLEKGERATPCG